ncbi:MAG TPA: molybdenum cofactor biosynthesis protein MoaE [Bryobacteraceae bacterium]|jgi:molybdopterin synthase catalytic subunit
MRVRVLFFGALKEITGHAEEALEVPAGATLEDVFRIYSERHETLRQRRPSTLFARNREFARGDAVLADGDEIAFLPPVSGGSTSGGSGDGHVFRITRERIDARRLAEALQRPEDGAVVVFEGVVRNNSQGRATMYLEYECYEEMARAQMEQIGREIAGQFAIGRIGMVHRLGRLEIGEASVAVVATAPHRKPAFDAAFEGINRLKREVPIWKKEYFADGAVWVDGEWDERLLAP